MQQDVVGVDSTPNAIRRIARSFIETGHNRIAAAAVASGRRRRLADRPADAALPSAAPFCDRSDVGEVAN